MAGTEIEVVLNPEGIRQLLHDPGVKVAVARAADAVAETGARAAGVVDGHQVEMRRTAFTSGEPLDDAPRSRSRVRSAVLVSHPTPKGREQGQRALLAAIDAARGAV